MRITIKMVQYRKFFWALLALIVIYLLVLYSRNSQLDVRDRELQLAQIDQFIKSHTKSNSCKLPDLPVNSSEMMKFVKSEPLIDCQSAEPDWISVKGSILSLSEYAKSQHKSVTCTFTDIIRVDDFNSRDGNTVTINLKETSYTLKESDVVRVSCKSYNKQWKSVLTGIRQDESIFNRASWSNLPPNALNLNVLIFGFDSLSRNTFIRKLPKSYKYLTDILDAQTLQGYNIVGDGTPQALIPMFTGKTELELPDTRKRIRGTSYVNIYPFIWNDFKKYGYVTAHLEDCVNIGTFTYRLRGFKEPPTDHYMRPYYLSAQSYYSHSPNYCMGSIPRHQIMMNHVRNFFSVYNDKPKFLFGFHGELSHDSYNLIGVVDDDLVHFLEDLNKNGYLKDTLLIMMADHGHRFADIRNTIQGKQEERLPFFSFVFPPSFKIKHKDIYENFVSNKYKLTTPFDIYATLKNVLNLENTGPADLTQRSLSLFSQISEKRSCSDAYIEPHWCSCLEWHKVPADSPILPQLTTKFLDTLNAYTEQYRQFCEPLLLNKLIWATELSPNDNFLHFKKNADYDGFIPDLSLKMTKDKKLYQIKVELIPGNSLFEASITHFITENEFELKLSDISRINKYGTQARCIEHKYHHIRKYCYCKDDL